MNGLRDECFRCIISLLLIMVRRPLKSESENVTKYSSTSTKLDCRSLHIFLGLFNSWLSFSIFIPSVASNEQLSWTGTPDVFCTSSPLELWARFTVNWFRGRREWVESGHSQREEQNSERHDWQWQSWYQLPVREIKLYQRFYLRHKENEGWVLKANLSPCVTHSENPGKESWDLFCFCCCDKIPRQKELRGEKGLFQPTIAACNSLFRGHWGKSFKQLVTSHRHSKPELNEYI